MLHTQRLKNDMFTFKAMFKIHQAMYSLQDLFTDRPENPLDYIEKWVNKEKQMQGLPHNKQ